MSMPVSLRHVITARKTVRRLLFVLLAVLLFVPAGNAQTTFYKTSSVSFSYSQLAQNKKLYMRDSYGIACGMPAVQTMIKKAKLRGKLDFGDDYDLGTTPSIACTLNVKVEAFNAFSSGTSIYTWTPTLIVNTGSPEQWFEYDFTSLYYQAQRMEVTITSYTVTPAVAQNTVRLTVSYDEDIAYDVTTSPGQPLCTPTAITTPTSSNPVTFNWTTTCGPAPNYQFQLLRLYNKSSSNTSDEAVVSADVDWDKALTIETGNSTTSLALTITEGQGYYIWRVRPIGNAYEGGIANWRNWGEWSSAPAQGATLSLVSGDKTSNTGHAYRFFYNQFDDDKNWSYSRVFVEGAADGSAQVSIGEQISYASALLMPKQQQGKLLQENDVMASQTVQDYSGRSALVTLAAPIGQTKLEYKSSYILDRSGGLYTADDFDGDGILLAPSPVHANSKLTQYYSDQNPDLTIPSSTDANDSAYPYVRTRYFRDGNNRAKETSMPGGTHKLGSGKTVRASYSGVSDKELVRVLGDEAPAHNSVHKMITTDQNNTSSVAYVNKEGQTIITCMAYNPNDTLLDTLRSRPVSGFSVRDTLTNNMPLGSNGIVSNNQVSFTEATTVTLYYDITPPYLEDPCLPLCRTCDYKIKFLIFNLDDPTTPVFKDSMTVTPDTTCTGTLRYKGSSYGSSFATVNLSAGDYMIERRVEGFQKNSSTGQTYLHEADSVLNVRLEQRFLHGTGTILGTSTTVDMDSIFGFLGRSDIDSLYNYIGASSTDSMLYVVMSCDTLAIPIVRCHEYDCSDSTPDFEDYLMDRWSWKYGSTLSTYLPGYTTAGQFNTLIQNMIATSDYDCYSVWKCWDAAVQSYDAMVTQMTAAGQTYDLLDNFLTCTGYNIAGFTTTAHGSPGYLSHAYAYFNYTAGTNTQCETAFCCPTSTVTCTCTTTQFNNFTATQWNDFHQCVQNVSGSTPTNTQILAYADAAEDTCRKVCQQRFGSFVQALVALYQDSGYAVETYVYPDTGYTPADTISLERIYCQAQNLVDDCQGNCDLTVYYNSGIPTQIDSIGSQAEQLAMQQAMSWTFDLALPQSNGSCQSGYDAVDTVNDSRVKKLVRYLNDQLQLQRASSGTYGKYWDYKTPALAFEPTLTGTSCLTSMNNKPYVYVHPQIESKFASGYDVMKTDSTSDAYTLYERIYPAQVKPGTNFFVTTRITVKQTLSSGTTGFTDVINNGNFTLVSGSMSSSASATVAAGTVITSTYVLNCNSGASGAYTFVTGSATRTGQSNLTLNTPSIYATACPSLNYVFNTTRQPIASLSSVSNGTGGIKYYRSQTLTTDSVISLDIINNTTSWLISTSFDPLQTSAGSYKLVSVEDSALHAPSTVSPSATMYRYSYADWTKLICETLCDVNDTCPKVCLKWIEPVLGDSVPVNAISCEEQTADYLYDYLHDQVARFIESHRDNWAADYAATCGVNSSLNDHFSYEYTLNYYHYTLYYYDRAGNLIQTVPPHGVDVSSTNRATHPSHKFITRYVYNSLQQLRWQETPDGGATWFWYNAKTQLRYSQNAKQKAFANQAWSYTRYDALGRPVEVGEFDPTASIDTSATALNGLTYPSSSDGTVRQRTFTEYNTPGSGVVYFGNLPQRYLQNRVSYSWHDDDGNTGTTDDQAFTYFSYDPHGNVEWMIQEQPELGRNYIGYEYDLISGSVLKVKYNEQLDDKFFHRYTYDKDKRVVTAETSVDNVIWDRDATYEYYKHGPLKRSNIGEDKVQGLDYVYTINGWIKGINHPSMVKTNDPGLDGYASGGTHQNTAKDEWGMILGYFSDDFKRSYSSTSSPYNSNGSNTWHLSGDPLYNGNISSWTSHIDTAVSGNVYQQLTGHTYRYDALNRITEADFNYYSGGSWNTTTNYDETFSYDGNGNLDQVTRNGYGAQMDDFTYKYYESGSSTYGVSYTFASVPSAARNRLAYVDDAANSASFTTDIDDQSSGNYSYDEIGNLTSDVAENVTAIAWTPYGKIESVTKSGGDIIKFYYDAMGNRIRKENIPNPSDPTQTVTTYYVRDAQGNVMSIYERRNTGTSPNFTATYSLIEQPIYGSSRIGQRRETSMTIRSVNYTSPASPAPPTQTILQEDAKIFTAAPVMNWTTVGNYTYTTMSVQRLNTETSTATSSTNQLTLSGVQGSNTTSVDDDCGNVILTSYTARSYNHQQHVCLIFDKFGYLVTNSGGIRSDAEAQSILMKMPGSQNLYYLFTVGTDKVPYYHVIDAGANVVVSKNTPLDAGGGYGRSMTLAEDVTGTGYASRLYLRYFSSGTSYVQSFTITAQGISATSALASFTSGDVRGNGELQISADGTQLTALNNKGVRLPLIQVYSGGGEFRRYDLSADHGTLSGVTTLTTGSNTALETGAWTSTDTYLYYTIRSFPGGVNLERWDQSNTNMTSVTAAPGGTVRRGYNDKLYVSTTNAVNYTEIATPDGTPSVGTVSVSSSAKLRGGLPVQKNKFYLINSCPGSTFTRNLDHKLYELTDHLGNVRVVISDIKESVINGTTNLPENFTATVEGYYNYYAFGAEMAGRAYTATSYRYNFQSQEKDPEIWEGAITYKYRVEDPRLGRFLSTDPLEKDYVYNSPYAFSENSTIAFVELEGLEKYYSADGKYLGSIASDKSEEIRVTKYSYTEGMKVFNTDPNYDKTLETNSRIAYTLDKENELLKNWAIKNEPLSQHVERATIIFSHKVELDGRETEILLEGNTVTSDKTRQQDIGGGGDVDFSKVSLGVAGVWLFKEEQLGYAGGSMDLQYKGWKRHAAIHTHWAGGSPDLSYTGGDFDLADIDQAMDNRMSVSLVLYGTNLIKKFDSKDLRRYLKYELCEEYNRYHRYETEVKNLTKQIKFK